VLRRRLSSEAFSSFLRNFRWAKVRDHYAKIVGQLQHA
jgi:hypothetical protein